MERLRKGWLGMVLALSAAVAGAQEPVSTGSCKEPACIELESDSGLLELSVALAKPANAVVVDTSAEHASQGTRNVVFPLSLVAVLFGLVGVVALARRRLQG